MRKSSRQSEDGNGNSVIAPGEADVNAGVADWTQNKLSILAGYLPAFNVASKRSLERLYIDLMVGEPFNRDAQTGEGFDGSARLAPSSTPPFTRIALCEMPQKAAALEKDLRARCPGRSFKVYPGDCNETIGRVLADLDQWRWAPAFVFADQQAAEIRWETLRKIAAFRNGKAKAEIWLLTTAHTSTAPSGLGSTSVTRSPATPNSADAVSLNTMPAALY